MGYRVQYRRDTAARWAEINPILLDGEIGYVKDNPNQYKMGDGVHRWNDLPLRGFDGTIAPNLGYDDNAVLSQRIVTEKFEEQNEKITELGSEVGNFILIKSKDNDFAEGSNIVYVNLEKGKKYKLTFNSKENVSVLGIFTKDKNGVTIDNFDSFENTNSQEIEFVSSDNADKVVFWISKVVSGIECRVLIHSNEVIEEIERASSSYTFVYHSGIIPQIKNVGSIDFPKYSVSFLEGTYYVLNNKTFAVKAVEIEAITYVVEPGNALVFDVETNELSIINHNSQVKSTRIILLNNMRLAQGQFEAILLNSTMNQQIQSEQILIFSTGKTPNITFDTNDNSYTVIFKDSTIYKKVLRTNVTTPIQTFVGKEESERTFKIDAGYALYYANGEFIIEQINNLTIGDSPFILLLENSRYAEAGQLLSVLFNTLYIDFKSLKQSLPNNVEPYDYTTFANISNYEDKMFEYVRPIRLLDFYVDEENMSDTFGLGVLEIRAGVGRFYIYDIDKGYNVCVIDIQPSEGQETLRGTTRLFGNYTYKNRINIYIDCVINWDLFTKSTATTSPTILFNPTASIGSNEFKSKFSDGSRIKGRCEEFFTVEVSGVNQNEAVYEGLMNEYVCDSKTYNDMCHFVMPDSIDGSPCKLVILCHGGGVTITESVDNWYNYQNLGKIFNAMGYAVLLTNGMPRDWANEHGIGIDRPCGNWMSVQSAVKAYNYVVNKYNIDTNGCYVYGQSQGGMVAENIAELSGLPILATVLESPAISMKYAQLYIPSAKSYLQALYGFDSQETYDESKCIGLDPFVRNVEPKIELSGNSVTSLDIDLDAMTNKKYRVNTPVLIIRSLDDTTISPKLIGAYAKSIINSGGNCKLLTYANASHSPIAGTDVVGTIDGFNVRSALYYILNYLSQFGGYSLSKIDCPLIR